MNLSFSYGYGIVGLFRDGEQSYETIKNEDGMPRIVNAFQIRDIGKSGKTARVMFYRDNVRICELQKRLIFDNVSGSNVTGPVSIAVNSEKYMVGTWKKEQ